MNNKTNYTIVGIFVVIGFILISFFGYWLLKPKKNEEVKYYLVYFDESVLGLNVNAPVKYKGIEVGKVEKLSIDTNNPEKIKVLISVLKTTPIKTSTSAMLTPQGITGLSYINLILGDKNSPELLSKDKNNLPVIKSTRSFFSSLKIGINDISKQVYTTLDSLNSILDKKNQQEFSKALKNFSSLLYNLNSVLDKKTIDDLKQSISNINEITQNLKGIGDDIKEFKIESNRLINNTISWENNITQSLKLITQSYLEMNKSVSYIGDSFKRGDFDLRQILKPSIRGFENTLIHLNSLLKQLEKNIDQYGNSPSDLFFKQSEIKKAPGE